jgi:uncharacterized protein (TIGR02145 family)
MNIKLCIALLFVNLTGIYGQGITAEGRLSTNRLEFINRAGIKSTREGVKSTGEINAIPPCTFLTVNHITSRGVAPAAKTVTYELAYSSITGTEKCWLMQNLGASNVPTSSTNNTEASSGWYWQFGSKIGYRYTTTRTPSTTYPNRTLTNINWTTSNDPCTIELGSGWRIPTYAEWQAVELVTSNLTSLFNSDLAMHAAGLLNLSGAITERGSTVHYWSTTSYSATHARAFVIPTLNGNSTTSTNDKDAGFSIRCIRD